MLDPIWRRLWGSIGSLEPELDVFLLSYSQRNILFSISSIMWLKMIRQLGILVFSFLILVRYPEGIIESLIIVSPIAFCKKHMPLVWESFIYFDKQDNHFNRVTKIKIFLIIVLHFNVRSHLLVYRKHLQYFPQECGASFICLGPMHTPTRHDLSSDNYLSVTDW